MAKHVNMIWVGVTAILTVILIAYLFPIMHGKYGLAEAILASLVLVLGMSLYYLRGLLISRSKPRGSQDSKSEE